MNRYPYLVIFPFLIIILFLSACKAKKETFNSSPESIHKQSSAHAVSEWQDQKFSMFIHFGLYSLPAGIWKNQKVTKGYSEQIRSHGKIPKEDYRQLAKTFNPVNWNPDSVVTLAKLAGMKSIVITSKHHDGFAMYHTKYSDFNIVDATPYKRDILKGLSEACRKSGLKFGVYFSLIDWDFPDALPISEHNSDSIPPKHHQLNLHQIEELMTNYGPISEIWFDMGKPTFQQSKELAELVRKHQPGCMVSGRLWHDQGDFAVMGDNASPDFRMGTLWQTPASMFDETWGYRSWQERGNPKEKALEKLTSLIKVVSIGGNYLLNIGPMGDGSIVPFEKEVLAIIGNWFNKNGEAIYGTTPSPLPEQTWGYISSKPGKLYLFLMNNPRDGQLVLKGNRSKLTKAYALSDRSKLLTITNAAGESSIGIGKLGSEDLIQVIVAEYDRELEYVPSQIITKLQDGSYQLTLDNSIKYHSYSGQDYYTTKPTVVKMEWFIQDKEEGKYRMVLQSAPKDKGKKLRLAINGQPAELILDGQPDQEIQSDFIPKPGKINTIQITQADQSNPHKDLGLEGLVIKLVK